MCANSADELLVRNAIAQACYFANGQHHTLMISCAVAKVPISFAIKDTMIMLIPMLVVLLAIIVFPDIVLFLPRFFSPELIK